MYSKHLISVTALLLSAACSSTPADDTGGSGGTSGTGAASGKTGSGGSQSGTGGTGMGGTTGTTGGTTGTTGGTTGTTGGTTGTTGGTTGTTGGTTGTTGGTTGTTGGTTGTTGGSAGQGSGGTGAGGTSGAGATGGVSPAGGSAGMNHAGNGGTGAGGSGAGGSGTAGMTGSGGSGGGTAVKCDNLSLAPSTTGVARPSGAAGGLKVLNWAGFKGAVSFTFDDNKPSQMADYSQLKATGGHFTWFVVGNWLNGDSSTIGKYKATMADGMEMANHTYSHNSAGSQSDLSQNETFIMTNFGVNANSMAAPNCDPSWASVAPNVMFQNRGPCGKTAATVGAGASDMTSAFALPAYLPDQDEAAATMSGSFQSDKWRIFVIHGFDLNDSTTYQPVSISHVTGAITTAVSGGYWVEGITNVGAYWAGQKLIPASATTTATWTKPAKFPSNMCLRITTTGGTVTQKGQTVPWNDHGYYEIGLDAGEVTIQ